MVVFSTANTHNCSKSLFARLRSDLPPFQRKRKGPNIICEIGFHNLRYRRHFGVFWLWRCLGLGFLSFATTTAEETVEFPILACDAAKAADAHC